MKYAKALEDGSVSFFPLILSTARSESKVIRWLGRLFWNRAIEHRLDAELDISPTANQPLQQAVLRANSDSL